jgi:hypothetical protein
MTSFFFPFSSSSLLSCYVPIGEQVVTFEYSICLPGISRTWIGPSRGTFQRRCSRAEGHRAPSTSGYCGEFKESEGDVGVKCPLWGVYDPRGLG